MKPHRLKSLYGYTKMFVGHGFSRDPLVFGPLTSLEQVFLQ